jgi:flagellar FliJ protein
LSKFSFVLENALKYRQSIEDREKELLARAVQKVQAEEKVSRKLNLEKQTHLSSYDLHKVNLTTMQQQEAYLFSLDGRIKNQLEEVERAQKTSNIHRNLVVKAASNRKVLERLKEKHLEEYQVILSKAEQKILDEVGIAAFCRKAEN